MSTPTIYKYLLDIFVAARIKTAKETGDAKTIARAHAAYDNLSESDVVFGQITRNESTGRYKTSITCKKRNWSATSVTFGTGTLKALCGLNLQGVAQLKSLALADRPGVFYIAETDTLYIMTEKDANIFEALKMTGWEIPIGAIQTVIYPTRKDELRAVGHVDIDHPIVTGRFMLDYFVREQAPVPTPDTADTVQSSPTEPTAADSEEVQDPQPEESTQQTEQTQESNEQAQPDESTDAAPAAEETTPAESQDAQDTEQAEEPTEENTQPAAEEKSSKSKK